MSSQAAPPRMASGAEVIPAPSALRDRIGPRLGRIDPNAIAKAEAALKGLSSQFGAWLQDEIGKLEAARTAIRMQGLDTERADRLYTHAHDLKGLGATYEFPLVSRIAGSLCQLLGGPEQRERTPLRMIDAHVDAICAAVRDGIKDVDHPIGRGMAEGLERGVSDYLRSR